VGVTGSDAPVTLGPGLRPRIVEHARRGYPQEVCGMIAGRGTAGSEIYPGENVSPDPLAAFELDPATLARQIDIEERGLEVVAFYHSHPRGPATPSARDVAEAIYPQAAMLICDLSRAGQPGLRAFRLGDRAVVEVELTETEP
jgi:proteasome lid subunit RPN8/RPN11